MIEEKTRRLFRKWFCSDEGGHHTGKVASCYGTYLQKANVDLSLFLADQDRVIDDMRPQMVAVRNALQNAKGDVHVGLNKFLRFLRWVTEHPWCTTYDELIDLLPAPEDVPQDNGGRGNVPRRNVRNAEIVEVDAYQKFFQYFANRQLTPESFYTFGLEMSIFADDADQNAAEQQMEVLISLLLTGTFDEQLNSGRSKKRKRLAIRKYSGSEDKSRLFTDLYHGLFPNANIEVEKGGNKSPKLNITNTTHCQLFTRGHGFSILRSTRKVLKNFQCSHVFDDRTKNPILFESIWNIALTPKMIDPLTGHETLGRWPEEFQPRFRNMIRRKFITCIRRFNALAAEVFPQVAPIATQVAHNHNLTPVDVESFVTDAEAQWYPIDEEMEQE